MKSVITVVLIGASITLSPVQHSKEQSRFDYCSKGEYNDERVLAVSVNRYSTNETSFLVPGGWRYLAQGQGKDDTKLEYAGLLTALSRGLTVSYTCDGLYVTSITFSSVDAVHGARR